MADNSKSSKLCDPMSWDEPEDAENAQIFPCRSGTQFVAGPFATLEEARLAWALLMMPPEGHA